MIDADYRGQVKVLLFNHSDVDFEGPYNPSLPDAIGISFPLDLFSLSLLSHTCGTIAAKLQLLLPRLENRRGGEERMGGEVYTRESRPEG